MVSPGQTVSPTNVQYGIALLIAASVGTAVWFHADRNKIKHPSAWASLVFLFLIIALPAYLIYVRRLRRRGRV